MTEKVLQSICLQLTAGYALCQQVFDEDGRTMDLILLEANTAFETMSGWNVSRYLGKRILREQENREPDELKLLDLYREFFMDARHTEKSRRVDCCSRKARITVSEPDSNHILLLLQYSDDSSEGAAEKEKEIQTLEDPDMLELIFDSTHDAMFLAEYENGNFRYLKNNYVHKQTVGVHEIEGKTLEELYGEKLGKKLHALFQQCIDSGEEISFELPMDFGNGTREWLTKLTPVRKKGQIRYLVGSRTDITELKRLRQDKEELLQRLEAMFGEHDAVMLMIHPDSGRIIDANPSACSFYGYNHDELTSMLIQEINQLPKEEVQKRRMMAYAARQKYFLFPHKLRSGEIRLVDVYSCPVTFGNQTELLSIIFDATDRENYRLALNREKELLRITLYSIGDGVVTTDNNGNITSLNHAAVEITGWRESEAMAKHYLDIMPLHNEDTGAEVISPIHIALKSGQVVGLANHTVLIRKDGRKVPIADSAAPIKDENEQTFGAVMVFWDVSHDKDQQRQILFLSYHDPLTGLYNRRYLEEQMRNLDHVNQLPLTVIMGDVNGLKITNDVFGHRAGDRLLQKVAEVFEKICHSKDVLARWGGDEFLLLLPQTSQETAEKMIEQARQNFQDQHEEMLQLSVSLGCATKTRPEENLELVLRKAEELMYHQKLLEGSSYRNSIINTLLATLYEKSMETEEHAERLKDYCRVVGKKLKLKADELNELALLAVLHDIGKVAVPQHILQKPGQLTLVEWEEMKRHSEIGYRIAQSTPELSVVADYILSHHERWDGGGYPRKLRGNEIPVLCRILSIADAYDAMTNDRVYRKAMTKEAAVDEIRLNSGTQFDPEITTIFLNVLPEIEKGKNR